MITITKQKTLFDYIFNKISLLKSFNFNRISKLFSFNLIKVNSELLTQNEILEKSTLLMITDLNGIIKYANKKFSEVTKYSIHEIIGKSQNIVCHSDNSPEILNNLWETISSGKIWQGELKNIAKDGTPYWVYATISPVIEANGKPSKFISVCQDITSKKLMEQELISVKSNSDFDLYENIKYAKYVHGTFLTPARIMKENFPESFIIYKAQKIVSGDFHMMQKIKNKWAIILGDSTGHGVSASYISIMIINILNRLFKISKFNPSEMLSIIHNEICTIRNANKTDSFIESADMAFCLLDTENFTLEYSIAKLRGIIFRKNSIIELEREKVSIGDDLSDTIKLKENKIQLVEGDVLYLYSDGIIDQFGGVFDKKFSNARLVKLIKEIGSLPMNEQEKIIEKTISDWKGKNEQTDDVSLIGIKIVNSKK